MYDDGASGWCDGVEHMSMKIREILDELQKTPNGEEAFGEWRSMKLINRKFTALLDDNK
jgi:hypothetical protein